LARFINILLDRGVMRILGGGPLGFVASAAVKWLRESLDEDSSVQVVTTEDLRVGERYTVIARPAPSKAERKLQAKLDKQHARLAKLTNPSPKEVKLARAIADNQARQAKLERRYEKRPDGCHGRRAARKLAKLRTGEQRLWARFDKADRTAVQRKMLDRGIAAISAALDAEREAALEAAAKKNRPERSKIYRVDD
jgi:hypothetical protein